MLDAGPWFAFLAFLALLLPLSYLAMPAALVYLAPPFLRAYERRSAATTAAAELAARLDPPAR